jgi:hypothetical protein
MIFTSLGQETFICLVLTIGSQILILQNIVMALPCYCSYMSIAALFYFWMPFGIYYY